MAGVRVAVVGGGISGLASAYVLAKHGMEVVLFEKKDSLGGRAKTVTVDGTPIALDFMVFNQVFYPERMEFCESLGIDMEFSDTSFSVSLDQGQGCEWGTRDGVSSLFAQKKNLFNPSFWKMMREISQFKDDAINYLEELDDNPDIERNETLGDFIDSHGYSEFLKKSYLIPSYSSVCPCASEGFMSFSAYSVLSYGRNHNLLQIFGQPQGSNVRLNSQNYVERVKKELESRGCQIRTGSEVYSITTSDEGCLITSKGGSEEIFGACIVATDAPVALKMLGEKATYDELRILGAFQYAYSDIFLHRDNTLMPKNPAAWSARNFFGSINNRACITYWLNMLESKSEKSLPLLMTVNPPCTPEHTLLKWSIGHAIPSVSASKASSELKHIQGKRRIWFTGAYEGYGFHEDGLQAGILAASGLLGKSCVVQKNQKHVVPSWLETGARLVVNRFLDRFIATGCLILLEEGGTALTFQGAKRTNFLRVCLRIHTPQFYWKVATESDLGLADAYINGDFSFVDKDEGLLNLFMISIANVELSLYTSKLNNKRAMNSSLSSWMKMTYSCAIFKAQDEDLKIAQLRKLQALIDKARIKKHHHILEIGFGWGSFAIEVVKQTGCRFTGITLSEKQLQYAELKVKEAGLQDQIELLLCDYREVQNTYKYDRIISCGMIEAVGHEYMEDFFRCCDSLLAENGLIVLQTSVTTDEKYDEFRLSQGFIKEYIFHGGILPSLSRMTSAMAAASRLCVVHLEEIGRHYYQTLRYWRKNFLKNRSQILALGFDEKFIRTYEYYFDYCASGYKMRILGNYQIVFGRPGDVAIFGDPYESIMYSAK